MTAAPGITHTEVEDLIRRTTDSTLERALTLKLRGDDALRVVNGLQRWSDATAEDIPRAAKRRCAIQLLVDLAALSGQVPDGHHLTGVQYSPGFPTWFGPFSDVHEGTWSRSGTVVRVVVKRLRMNEGDDELLINWRLCIEGLKWRQFVHPNIVKFLGVYSENSSDGRVRPGLVSLRIEENLRFFIHSAAYNPRVDRKRLLIEIASALVYLDEQEIAHGDVSLINILAEGGHAFLTDFGLIAVGNGCTGRLSVPRSGHAKRMTPEVISATAGDAQDDAWLVDNERRESRRRAVKAKASDVFAYGRLIIAITVKEDPFGAINYECALRKVKCGSSLIKPPDSKCHGAPLSDSLWELATACWRIDPTMRPTMEDLIRSLSALGFDA